MHGNFNLANEIFSWGTQKNLYKLLTHEYFYAQKFPGLWYVGIY